MTTTQTTDERRGYTSASNALADSLCKRRFLLQQGQPDESSKDAESGSRIHAALAKFVTGDGHGNRAELAALSLDEREVYDRCLAIEGKIVPQFFAGKLDGLRVFREQRLWAKIAHNGSHISHSGKPDVVYRAGLKAIVIEYKTARGEVSESPRNLQLRDQAVLVRGTYVPTNEIGTVVIQPLVTMTPTIAVYNQTDLELAAKQMFDRVIGCHDPNAKAVPGDAQCQYCRAKRICPEYAKWAGQMTPPAMLTVLEVPMQSWTPAQCATAAAALAPAEKFLDQLKAFLKQKLEADPASVPGWFLQPGSVRERITDPQKVFERFSQLGGKVEQFMACVTVGKGDLKKALNEVSGAKGKALEQAMGTVLAGCVEEKQAAPMLKRKDEGEQDAAKQLTP
jgi:hypothetical protein